MGYNIYKVEVGKVAKSPSLLILFDLVWGKDLELGSEHCQQLLQDKISSRLCYHLVLSFNKRHLSLFIA